MLSQILDYARNVFTLKAQTEKNTADIKEIRQELKELTSAVQRAQSDIDRLREKEADEREKLMLRLELVLTKFENRLPPGAPGRQDSNLLE